MTQHIVNRFLSLLCVPFLILSAKGEDAPPQNPESQVKKVIRRPAVPPPEASAKVTRFDLDFPGGTPAELVEAISEAMGKRVNVIIPERDADVRIMPIRVEQVNTLELFSAIAMASEHEIAYVSSRGGGIPTTTEWRKGGVRFQSATPGSLTDETVWSFASIGPSPEELAKLNTGERKQICRYFQLEPYLRNHTIEDITTAIQTGWKMLGVDPMPQLSFHEETKLLIVVGDPVNVEQIPAVLSQLSMPGATPPAKPAQPH